jgi:hypothetical protein
MGRGRRPVLWVDGAERMMIGRGKSRTCAAPAGQAEVGGAAPLIVHYSTYTLGWWRNVRLVSNDKTSGSNIPSGDVLSPFPIDPGKQARPGRSVCCDF